MSSPDKALKTDREKCYIVRDDFFKCLDQEYSNGLTEEQALKKCSGAKKAFDKACPSSWVGHFIRKYNFERYKQQLAEQGLNVIDKNALDNSQKHKLFRTIKNYHRLFSQESSQNVRNTKRNRIDYLALLMNKVPPKSQMINSTPIIPVDYNNDNLLSLIPKTASNVFKIAQYKSTPNALQAARTSQYFKEGRKIIEQELNNLDGMGIVEAARLLAFAHVCNKEFPADKQLAARMLKRLNEVDTLPPMKESAKLILSSIADEDFSTERAVERLLSEEKASLLFKQEIKSYLIYKLLNSRKIDIFFKLAKGDRDSGVPLHNSPEAVYWILALLRSNQTTIEERNKIRDWYFDALLNQYGPIDHVNFINFTVRIFKALKIMIEPTFVLKDGTLDRQNEFRINKSDMEIDVVPLQKEFEELTKNLSEKEGSLTKREAKDLINTVKKWKAASLGDKALVVDSLNVGYFGKKFNSMLQRISEDFPNILLVTRQHNYKYLRPFEIPGNVRIFACDNYSEDDLLVILAALQWGKSAYIMSNDRYLKHIERISPENTKTMRDWLTKRVIRVNREIGAFMIPENWRYRIQKLVSAKEDGREALFLPVIVDTANLPYHRFWIVRVPH